MTDETSPNLRVARIGSAVSIPPEVTTDPSDVQDFMDKVKIALRDDVRVREVKQDRLRTDANAMWPMTMYPVEVDAPSEAILTGSDARHGVHHGTPLRLWVQVPTKNQPHEWSKYEPLSEDYYAVWDGCSLAVAWEQELDHTHGPGGQVVLDVLGDALQKAGGSLFEQKCAALCDFRFLHVDLLMEEQEDGQEGEGFTYREVDEGTVAVHVPPDTSLKDFADRVLRDVAHATRSWTQVKNYGERILRLEGAGRAELSKLLTHYREHTETYFAPWYKGWLQRLKPWRSEARALIARVWLVLSWLELMLGQREGESENFRRFAMQDGVETVVDRDIKDDDYRIATMDLTFLRDAANHAAARLDTRTMAGASAWGALGGVIAGAIVTVILAS